MAQLFDWVVNNTRMTHGFLGWFGKIDVMPGVLADLAVLDQSAGSLARTSMPLEHFQQKGISKFWLQRTFSFGDTLMTVPVVRMLKQRYGYDVAVKTDYAYEDVLHRLGIATVDREAAGPGVLLDYEVERDHFEPALQTTPRVHIYAKALGVAAGDMPKDSEWDWSLIPENFPSPESLQLPINYVVVQGRGSTSYRGMSNEAIECVVGELAAREIKVIYIGEKTSLTLPADVMALYQSLSLAQLVTLILYAKAVVAMDSSPLWVSHFTSTPVVAVLGPSRPEERLRLHPLWEEGAKAIRVNELIKCESCFEQAEACQYTFRCMSELSAEKAAELIVPEVVKFWET